MEALGSIASGVPLADPRLAAGLAVLDRAAEPNESATELPALKSMRLLAAAAARQAGRKGLSDDQWRMLVISTASPKPPVDPSK